MTIITKNISEKELDDMIQVWYKDMVHTAYRKEIAELKLNKEIKDVNKNDL